MEIKLNIISERRKELMGVATLLVIVVHLWYDELPDWLYAFKSMAQIGVDMFVLLSGLGCYFSLKKNGTKKFYWNRFKKVVIPYLIVFLAYNAFRYYAWGYSLTDCYTTYSLGAFFISYNVSAWFILCILLFYLVAPLLYKSFLKADHSYLYVIFVLWIIATTQLDFILDDPWYSLNEYILMRFPTFMFGMYLAMKLNHLPDRTIQFDFKFIFMLVLLIVASCIDLMFNSINRIAIFRILSIFLSYYLCVLFAWLYENGNKILSFIGDISLWSYLLNERLSYLLYIYIPNITNIEINILAFVATLILGCLMRKIVFVSK